MRTALPEAGTDWETLAARLDEMAAGDVDWRRGRAAVYVFDPGEDVRQVAARAYARFISENGLGPAAFPSLARMEREIIEMSLGLLHAPDGAAGGLTSGGSESILMAVKTCREWWRAQGRDTRGAEILVPVSAHPAFDKAAALLDMTVVRAPVAADWRADVAALEARVGPQTAMLVASAPCFPYGVIDPVAEVGALAEKHGLWLHVDACVGGYLAPFVRMNGGAVPDFDFAVPQVRSMSADLHKYGWAAKGASCVMYRDADLFRLQPLTGTGWPLGTMTTPTMAGTRPGGAIAAAWSVMNHLGVAGYRDKAAQVVAVRQRLEAGLADIADLRPLIETHLGITTIVSDAHDVLAAGEAMRARGWVSARLAAPPAIHLMLSPGHAQAIDDYLADLADSLGAAGGKTGGAFYA
jgi:glutamate/tyrosine decarboxylase-like PLP-dependent enzyme